MYLIKKTSRLRKTIAQINDRASILNLPSKTWKALLELESDIADLQNKLLTEIAEDGFSNERQ
ncbi:MAG: hypothetical protein KatS3mg087_0613 [Patescibacteria group bacterium]|jgi:hypothetical protein|nr:MAG: hypothetical protein KatS3mg087_0613 [Patescibacteria group bacterium]